MIVVKKVKFTPVCVSLMVISLMVSGISSAKIDFKDCVGMWLFDKDKGDVAKDSSSKGNDGTIVGKAKRIEGKFGSALEFGGDAHVHAGKLVLPKNQITMVLWVSINTSKPWIHIIENGVVEFTWHGGFRLEVGGEGITYIAIGDGAWV